MRKKCVVARHFPSLHSLNYLSPILQRIYASRAIQSPADLNYVLSSLLHYNQLKGSEDAAVQLAEAIKNQERIIVIGDFDADGATSTALAVSALRLFGAYSVSYLVPNRFEYGYGLTPEIVRLASAQGAQWIITVDNGITSIEGVATAHALRIKVIITDHHLPGKDLPLAEVIVNPQQPGDGFPSKNLAGVGVIFYTMLALRNRLREKRWFSEKNIPDINMAQFLDLVALGTIADVVPLDYNNRILVHHGLQLIRQGKARPGIQALLKVGDCSPLKVGSKDLGFSVAPRLNAAGRLTDMRVGIECLLAKDFSSAYIIANQLHTLNQERRVIEKHMQQEADLLLQEVDMTFTQASICLFNEKWHQGVIGLLAARIKERFYKPTIIFSPGNHAEELKGSARSIDGFHIREVLEAIAIRDPTLLTKFGGHAMAAGVTLIPSAYPAFSQAFENEVYDRLGNGESYNQLLTDGELTTRDLTLDLAEILQNAGPWGQAFPEPSFLNSFHILDSYYIHEKHLKMTLQLTCKISTVCVEAIVFNVREEEKFLYKKKKIDLVYRLAINEFGGQRKLQLIVEHAI